MFRVKRQKNILNFQTLTMIFVMFATDEMNSVLK